MTGQDAIALARHTSRTVEVLYTEELQEYLEGVCDEGDGWTFNGPDWTVVLVPDVGWPPGAAAASRVLDAAARTNRAAAPVTIVDEWGGLETSTVGEVLAANAEDPDLCAAIEAAEPGKAFRWGGGASPLIVITVGA